MKRSTRFAAAGGVVAVALAAVACMSMTVGTPAPTPFGTPAAVTSPLEPATPTSTVLDATLAPPTAPSSATPVTPTAHPSPEATPTPAATAEPPGTGLEVDWRQVERDAGLGRLSQLVASAAANGRFVVVAWDDDAETVLFTSANGRTWQRVELPASDEVEIVDVEPGGPGFVAVGQDYASGAVSYVSIDGLEWERSELALGAGQFGFAGHVGTRVVATMESGLLVSDDGRSWTQATLPDGFGDVLALASDELTITAFAASAGFDGVTVWQSMDGSSWERRGRLPGSRGVDYVMSVTGPLGSAAVGSAYRRSGGTDYFAWHSQDGRDWQTAIGAPSGITDLYADDAGFIAVGHFYPNGGCAISEDDAWGTTWTSVDGSVWRQMPEQGWHHREIDLLRRLGRTLIGIGIDWTRGSANGSIWTADLPQPPAEGPIPAPTPTPAPQGCGS